MSIKKKCKFHVVFATKYRYAILHNDARAYLQEYFARDNVQDQLGYKLINCAVEPDHVHLAFEYGGNDIEGLVGKLKGRSAFALHKKCKDLLRYIVWSGGSYIGTMGDVSQKTIDSYIAKQGYAETEVIDRTYKFSVLPSKRKSGLCEQYIEGVKNKDGTKVPAAMLQRTDGSPSDSFKLRNDLFSLEQTKNKLSDCAIKVSGGKKCKTKPFWLALKQHRNLPKDFITRESRVRKVNDRFIVSVVVREERRINKFNPKRVIALDLGIKRPVTSVTLRDGEIKSCNFWGKKIKRQIWLREKRRATLQSASKEHSWEYDKLCTAKYNRRIQDLLHKWTKDLVNKAKESGYSIAIGNLKSIRKTAKHKYGPKKNNTSNFNLHTMPFGKLKDLLQYKAKLASVPLLFVNEAYTSQTCRKCSHTDIANRNRRSFYCKSCGYKTDADLNGSCNIARKASQLSAYDSALQRTLNSVTSSFCEVNVRGNPSL